MKKYQELVEANAEVIQELKELRKQRAELRAAERGMSDRASALFASREERKAADLLAEAEEIGRQWQDIDETIYEYEDDIRAMLHNAYEDTPSDVARRQGFAGFYRVAGL